MRRVNFTKGDEKGGDMAEQKFKIERSFFEGYPDKTIKRGLTEEDARAWCNDPETSSATCKSKKAQAIFAKYGEWFDGYTEDK